VTSHTKVSLSYPLVVSELRLTEQLNTLCRGEKHAGALAKCRKFVQKSKAEATFPPTLHSAAASVEASHPPCAQDAGENRPDKGLQRTQDTKQGPTSLLPTETL